MNPSVAHGLAAVCFGLGVFASVNAVACLQEGRRVVEPIVSTFVGLLFCGAAIVFAIQ